MNTTTKRISVLKLTSISLLCGFLTACGGSSGGGNSDPIDDDTPPAQAIGFQLDSSNYEASFQTAAIDTATLLTELLDAGNEVDFNNLENLGVNGNTVTFACDNQGGLIQATVLTATTNEAVFTNCAIETDFSSTTYNGITTVDTTIHSGEAANIGSLFHDWEITQNITMDDFSRTSPIIGGIRSVSNGTMVLESANNIASSLNTATLTSSNLEIATTDASGVLTSRQFSNLFYDILEDDSDGEGISELDLDYTANITGLGDVTLATVNEQVTDANGFLLSGTGELNTGASLLRIVGTGNDNVDVFIDPENDGTFEAPLFTTWTVLSGS